MSLYPHFFHLPRLIHHLFAPQSHPSPQTIQPMLSPPPPPPTRAGNVAPPPPPLSLFACLARPIPSTSHLATPCTQGTNALGLAVMVLSTLPAGSTPALPSARAGAA